MFSTQERTSEAPLEVLEREIIQLGAQIAAATYRWLMMIGELDRRRGWEIWECRSCAHWLNWKCGIDLRAAYEKVRVARALSELPVIAKAFEQGELSYSKVRALTRVATPASEGSLVEMARYATASHIERIVRAYRRVLATEDISVANVRHANRYLRWHHDDDGSVVIQARLSPEDGAWSSRRSKQPWSRPSPSAVPRNTSPRTVPRNTSPRTVPRNTTLSTSPCPAITRPRPGATRRHPVGPRPMRC